MFLMFSKKILINNPCEQPQPDTKLKTSSPNPAQWFSTFFGLRDTYGQRKKRKLAAHLDEKKTIGGTLSPKKGSTWNLAMYMVFSSNQVQNKKIHLYITIN